MSREEETRETHPSFGMVSASRVTGTKQLFGVSHPQMHFVRVCVHEGERVSSHVRDMYMQGARLIEFDMSEVQWASLIASMNTDGTPCTLAACNNGKYVSRGTPPDRAPRGDKLKSDVVERMRMAIDDIKGAITRLNESLDGPARKGDLRAVKADLESALMQVEQNIPYFISRVHEEIEQEIGRGKGEIEAYALHRLRQLGEHAVSQITNKGEGQS